MTTNKKIWKSIDLFAGIGGMRLGFEKAFSDSISTTFVSEWDRYAQKTYLANFCDTKFIAGDITDEENQKLIKPFDICLAGFPCQAFSMAGKRQGFEDHHKGKSRGTLFFEVAKICSKFKPAVIFCENVKGLLSHDNKKTFAVIEQEFKNIGYIPKVAVLNSKNFGVPQNRERLYIVAFREDLDISGFEFPSGNEDTNVSLLDIREESAVPAKYYLSDVYLETLRRHKEHHKSKGQGFGYVVRDWNDISGTVLCSSMGRERNLVVDFRQKNLIPTTHIKGSIDKEGIRKLTPREFARLQGFSDEFKFVVSDAQLYKQFGNTVTINVVEAIARNIRTVLEFNYLTGKIT